MATEMEQVWQQDILNTAFDEYKGCVRAVYRDAETILQSPAQTPVEFEVKMAPIPDEFYAIGKNLFSTLFQSVYHLLEVPTSRRILYGKLNHLFRIWVTSADNLLDDEDKIVVPMKIAGSSRVMRQVISIMLADRILKEIVDEAVADGTVSKEDGALLVNRSLQVLLPSAAEEASEEGGITHRPDADYVLDTIHRLKTGLLFHLPFLGIDTIERDMDEKVLSLCKKGLMTFGLGCQILDDIRDVAKDHLEARHNYILSKLSAEDTSLIAKLDEPGSGIDGSSNVFGLFPEVVHPAAEKAMGFLTSGLLSLGQAGLGINKAAAVLLSYGMFDVLGIGELATCLGV